MKLKAMKYMRYARKQVNVGDVFEANAQDVKILLALRRAEVYVEPVKAKIPAVFKPFVPATPLVDPMPAAETPEADADKPKRAYKRRDMTAEE